MTTPNDDMLRRYVTTRGADAVRAAAAGDWETAGEVTVEISNLPGGLGMLLYGLCDTIIDLTRRSGRTPAAVAEIGNCRWCADEATEPRYCTCPYYCGLEGCAAQAGGEVTLAPVAATSEGDIPDYYTWCSLFLAARSRLDREKCEALLEEFPGEWEDAAPYVMTLLRSCAALINPAGEEL
jgi:hypothetical protein